MGLRVSVQLFVFHVSKIDFQRQQGRLEGPWGQAASTGGWAQSVCGKLSAILPLAFDSGPCSGDDDGASGVGQQIEASLPPRQCFCTLAILVAFKPSLCKGD